jgi:hypothetical protein
MSSENNEVSFVKTLCPILYFDKNEIVFPCNVGETDISDIFEKLHSNSSVYYDHHKNERYVTFVLFYQKDGGIHNIGAHKHDIEYVRVFYDENNKPVQYYLSEHGRDQGLYIESSKLKHEEDTGRPIVYVAKSTHAHYPGAGVWVRGFCFANDVTGHNIRWDPASNLTPIPNIADLKAKFGDGHMQWSAEPKDIIGAPTKWYFWYRFLYPLSKKIRFYMK